MSAKRIFLMILIPGLLTTLFAQEDIVDELSVPLSKPGEPMSLELGLLYGSIHVTGYEGKTVEIEAITRLKEIDKDKDNDDKKNRNGMNIIYATSSCLEVEEDNNHVEIDVESIHKTVDVNIKVPYRASLEISTHHNGQIRVEHITGNLEVENHHGSIYLSDISGSVVANTHHGEIKVIFTKVDSNKPMSFSTYHKDIDITFPSDVKANVKLKSERGQIYSDFKIIKDEKAERVIQEKSHREDGKYKVRIEHAYFGLINGGGPEYQFNSYHGDILIRKSVQ